MYASMYKGCRYMCVSEGGHIAILHMFRVLGFLLEALWDP